MAADYIILFIFGLAFGSFFNVIISRYDGKRVLADPRVVNGRSHCPQCRKTLAWFELIPLVSFLVQGGRCRHCRKRISFQYPMVELLTGLIFVGVPWRFTGLGISDIPTAMLWVVAFCLLLIMAGVDLKLGIVPDELTIVLFLVAVVLICVSGSLNPAPSSFFGSYVDFFGLRAPFWLNRILGAVAGLVIFGGLWLLTRGKGMGLGDVKLAVPLGLLFGWPDVFFLGMLGFIIGAAVGISLILIRKKTMRSAVPFGPFLAIASVLVFFCGSGMAAWYFGLMGL